MTPFLISFLSELLIRPLLPRGGLRRLLQNLQSQVFATGDHRASIQPLCADSVLAFIFVFILVLIFVFLQSQVFATVSFLC